MARTSGRAGRPEPRRYEILLTKTAERGLESLPADVRERCGDAIEALADDPRPHGVKKLRGKTDLYRLRVGDYRVMYKIDDDRLEVTIARIGDRRDIYRGL